MKESWETRDRIYSEQGLKNSRDIAFTSRGGERFDWRKQIIRGVTFLAVFGSITYAGILAGGILANFSLGLPPETIFNSIQSLTDMDSRPLFNTSLYTRPAFLFQLGSVLGLGGGMILGAVAGIMGVDFIMKTIRK